MEKLDSFNIRVYGLLIHQGALMILKEPYAGEILYKFPGGGLEFGEGTLACLERELIEELNLQLTEAIHFYTQEEFIRSKFRSNEQLLTLYYRIKVEDITVIRDVEESILEIMWVPLDELNIDHVNLPIDRHVVQLLLQRLNLE